MGGIESADITRAFAELGIGAGDCVMLHGDAMPLAQLPPMTTPERFESFFGRLESLLGPQGTLVLPTFTYSFTEGQKFDPVCTPSKVGSLTEFFRTRPDIRRSRDPIFSIAASGRLAADFATAAADDCFGPGSAFALLDAQDAWLVCMGCSFDRVTFTHFVEQASGVDYRYFKEFSGEIVEDGLSRQASVRYFVRDLGRRSTIDLSRLRARLAETGRLRSGALGRVGMLAVRARDFRAAAEELLADSPAALIAEGREP